MTYKCTCCGKEHEEWPALTYNSPDYYNNLSEHDKQNIATLSNDFCTITHPDQTDRFIRCVLIQKVNDSCQNLDYGLWVSLSEKNYDDYFANFNNDNSEATYFGWLSNDVPEYDFPESIPTTVRTQTDGNRPEIIPHKDFDHPFVHDYYNGITKAEAEKRINDMLTVISSKNKT